MQIDLFEQLQVDSILQDGQKLDFRRDGRVIYVSNVGPTEIGGVGTVTVHYQGRPIVAENAPWDGGRDVNCRPPAYRI